MKRHIANTRGQLSELDALARKTAADEHRILERASSRFDEVTAMIERQRPGVEGASDDAQSRYLDLVEERGQLQNVIAKAKRSLAGQS